MTSNLAVSRHPSFLSHIYCIDSKSLEDLSCRLNDPLSSIPNMLVVLHHGTSTVSSKDTRKISLISSLPPPLPV